MISARTALGAVLIAATAALVACGGDAGSSGETPGFGRDEQSASEQTFELAQPNAKSDATTIPGPGPTLFVPGRVTAPPITDTTTTTPRTTTTFPIPQSPLRPVQPTSFCGFTEYLFSLVSVFTNPEVDVELAVRAAPGTIQEYRRFTPTGLGPDVELVANTVGDLIGLLTVNDYDVAAPPVRQTMAAIITNDPSYQPFLDAYVRVQFVEAGVCGQP